MPVAAVDEVLELERIERAAWLDLARLMPAAVALAIGHAASAHNGTLLFMASRIPVYQFNWLSGSGLEADDGGAVEAAVGEFAAAGQRRYFVQVPPGPNASRVVARAIAAGLVRHPLAWAKFVRATEAPPPPAGRIAIREVAPQERDLFAATAIEGFGMPAALGAWLGRIVGEPGWHAYLASDALGPCGAAALYVSGDCAWLGIGSTKPARRGQGAQSALLARRIADAAAFGARRAVTETGVPQPGQPAPSYRNILRAGFEVAYERPNFALPG